MVEKRNRGPGVSIATTPQIEQTQELCEYRNLSGHSLVVKHVLAKDETGFRLPLAAQSQNCKQKESCEDSFCLGQLGKNLLVLGITDTTLRSVSSIHVVNKENSFTHS